MSPISGLSGYVLVPLRESADFTLYRGRKHDDPSPVLAIALFEQPSPQSIRRLMHEYSFAAELDPAWAAKPLAISRHEGRTILVLKDPGGEPLDRVLDSRPRATTGADAVPAHRHWLGDSTGPGPSARLHT